MLFAALQMLIFTQESTGGSGVLMGSAGLYSMLLGWGYFHFSRVNHAVFTSDARHTRCFALHSETEAVPQSVRSFVNLNT